MAGKCRASEYILEPMRRSLPFIIIIVVLIAGLGVGYALLRKSSNSNNPNVTFMPPSQNSDSTASAPNNNSSAAKSEPVTKPNVKVSSPVEVEEYGDYQCPPCGKLYPELKKIEEDYGNQVHFVFHYFPLIKIHKNAMAAARAAEAARLQNKFWQMHDRLYRNQSLWAEAADPRPIFISFAQQLGLNTEQFQSDMESNRVEQTIMAETQRALSLGVNGTPTLVIEGQQLRPEATNPDGIRRGINVMLERKAVS
jgi:protein-disulfide isomerase